MNSARPGSGGATISLSSLSAVTVHVYTVFRFSGAMRVHMVTCNSPRAARSTLRSTSFAYIELLEEDTYVARRIFFESTATVPFGDAICQ